MLVNDTFGEDAPRREIRALAAKLVKEDHNSELGFAILGHCAMHDGKDAAALRFFQRATSLDPKLVDAARLTGLLAMRAASEPRRPSFIDAQKRAKARGQLDALLDELVPPVLEPPPELSSSAGATTKATDAPRAKGPAQVVLPARRASPDGTLEAQPPPPAGVQLERTALPTPPGPPVAPEPAAATRAPEPATTTSVPPPSLPSVPPAKLSLAPSLPPSSQEIRSGVAPTTAPEKRPEQATEKAPEKAPEKTNAPSPPPASVPVTVTQPLTPQRPAVAAAPAVTPLSRNAGVSSEGRPTERPRRRRTALLVGWIASLGLTGVAAYVIGSRTFFEPEPAITTIDGARTLSSSVAGPTASSPATASLASSAPVASVVASSTSPSPSSSVLASADAAAPSGAHAQTGILKTPKGIGRRVYVDGRVIGEGREHTIACGRHRIRVGSTGLERSVTVPCGGTIELD
jgi:hypothetical protein